MEKIIKEILTDIYALDGNFRKYESELIGISKKLLAVRPEVQIDDQFRQELKQKVLTRFQELSVAKNQAPLRFNFNFNFMSKFKFAFALAVVAIIVGGTAYYYQLTGEKKVSFAPLFADRVMIKPVGDQAFGSLALFDQASVASPEGKGAAAGQPAGYGGGGAPLGESMVWPLYVFDYQYVGGEINLPDSLTLPVYKRSKDQAVSSVVNILNNLDLGLINMQKFHSKNLQNFTIVEDRPFGYIVSVDFEQSQVNIFENWKKWPNPFTDCQTPECWQQNQLQLSDVPSDQELIDLANNFLATYGISRTNYGQPVVINDWQNYIREDLPEKVYVPDVISVIYPFVLDGRAVYDEGGRPFGLRVNVNIRYQQVAGLGYLTSLNFQSSNYEIVNDSARLVELAEQGNWRYTSYWPETARRLKVELGDPQLILAIIWLPAGVDSEELYVPALSFPVLSVAAADDIDMSYMQNSQVVVPLVKDILDTATDNDGPVFIQAEVQ